MAEAEVLTAPIGREAAGTAPQSVHPSLRAEFAWSRPERPAEHSITPGLSAGLGACDAAWTKLSARG